jgi:hypothetical protein
MSWYIKIQNGFLESESNRIGCILGHHDYPGDDEARLPKDGARKPCGRHVVENSGE